MKSVTIKNKNGELLIKIKQNKDGTFEYIKRGSLIDIEIKVIDDDNKKIIWTK